VVVGRRAAHIGVGRRARRHELTLAAALGVAAAAEELHGVGDDLDRLALRAVLGLPLTPVEAAVDAYRASLGEVLRAALALVPPDGDVEVVRLVAPLAGLRILLACVHGQAELADGGAARRVPELGVPGQVADEDDSVDVGHRYSSPSVGSPGPDCSPAPDPANASPYPCSRRAVGGGPDGVGPGFGRLTAMCRSTPSVILSTRAI